MDVSGTGVPITRTEVDTTTTVTRISSAKKKNATETAETGTHKLMIQSNTSRNKQINSISRISNNRIHGKKKGKGNEQKIILPLSHSNYSTSYGGKMSAETIDLMWRWMRWRTHQCSRSFIQ
mmetsp:Transcript_59674/g.66746  ORF Transcript_59674/g.66746 Transcript_59674/m.66746 type:complete len:122 (-) Transcript_59674:1-366(-)